MPEYPPRSAEGYESHLLFLAGFKSHSGPGGHIEMHPSRLFTVERESSVHFEKVIMAADLNRTIACVANENRRLFPPGIGQNWFRSKHVFAWNHRHPTESDRA